MGSKRCGSPLFFVAFFLFFLWPSSLHALKSEGDVHFGPVITKEQRRIVAWNENGAVSAVDVNDGYRGPYHLEFISLEPNSLFLPVLLHNEMVFYVRTGRGIVSWVTEDETKHMDVEPGDIYRLEMGSVFYIRSRPDPMRERLRINAIFENIGEEKSSETCFGAYSNLSDLIRGFDEEVLQMGFKVSKEVIGGLKIVDKPPPIIPFPQKNAANIAADWEAKILEVLIGGGKSFRYMANKKKKKKANVEAFNIFKEKPDVKNCYGWSTAVTRKDLRVLKESNIGVFMVNLTRGSMMGPHWNPMASEIAIVTHGEGMIQVVFPGNVAGYGTPSQQQSKRFRVKEGDIFIVPRYHPMAQMSFNNDYLVFMGFSTMANKNHPQYLAGSRSVFQALDKEILALSFNVPNTTIAELLGSQDEAIMLDCNSCAKQQEKRMEEEIEKERQEEEARRRKEEEEARKREEEEERRRQQEEEERKRQEEEEKRRQQEEEARRQEEERQRQEEEEAKRQEEEERQSRQEKEERQRQQQQEERQRQQEDEEEAQREEEERQRQQEEEEARRQEKEARSQQEEEESRRQEEKEEEEEEEPRREEEARGQQEEEEGTRQEEEREREQHEEEARGGRWRTKGRKMER